MTDCTPAVPSRRRVAGGGSGGDVVKCASDKLWTLLLPTLIIIISVGGKF